MSKILKLTDVEFRSDESKILAHKLSINAVAQNLTGWTIKLFANETLLKTITTASASTTQGKIKDQGANVGEYFFTLLSADLVTLKSGSTIARVPCYVRYETGEIDPPRTFSNVEFILEIR